MVEKNQDRKSEKRENQDEQEKQPTEKVLQETQDVNNKNSGLLQKDAVPTSQKTVNTEIDKNNPFVIEDGSSDSSPVSARIDQAREMKALNDNFSIADQDQDGTLSKEELTEFANNESVDRNARSGAVQVLDRFDKLQTLDSDSGYWTSANISNLDISKLTEERYIEAAKLRGLAAFDTDGDGTATREELYEKANSAQSQEDREMAYALYSRGNLAYNVADEGLGSGNDRGITQNDLDFEVDSFKAKAGNDLIECNEALNAFPELKNSGIRPEDLKALIDNEVRKRGAEDWFQDTFGWPGDNTVGEAQIKQSTIVQLKKDYPNLANLDEFDSKNAPIFAAAVLAMKAKELDKDSFGSQVKGLLEENKKPLADRAREIQDNWNSGEPERKRIALLKSYNPWEQNAEHYDVIQKQVTSRPTLQPVQNVA